MAGEPAIIKIRRALAAALATIPGVKVFDTRTSVEPLAENELPALVLRVVESTFDAGPDLGDTFHQMVIDLDLYDGSDAADAVTDKLAVMLSQVMQVIHDDRSLGGMLQSLEEQSFTAASENVPDFGCGTLTLQAQFVTPRGDFNTIMGASAPIP